MFNVCNLIAEKNKAAKSFGLHLQAAKPLETWMLHKNLWKFGHHDKNKFWVRYMPYLAQNSDGHLPKY